MLLFRLGIVSVHILGGRDACFGCYAYVRKKRDINQHMISFRPSAGARDFVLVSVDDHRGLEQD